MSILRPALRTKRWKKYAKEGSRRGGTIKGKSYRKIYEKEYNALHLIEHWIAERGGKGKKIIKRSIL